MLNGGVVEYIVGKVMEACSPVMENLLQYSAHSTWAKDIDRYR